MFSFRKSGMVLVGMLLILGGASPALATESESESELDLAIGFKGTILDGPLANHVVKGKCRYASQGNVALQTGPCTLTVAKPPVLAPPVPIPYPNSATRDGRTVPVMKMTDPQARLAIVGTNNQLEITMGIPLPGEGKGNRKLNAFKVVSTYNTTIALTKLPPFEVTGTGVSLTLLGIGVSQHTPTTVPECLIWDLMGPEVHSSGD